MFHKCLPWRFFCFWAPSSERLFLYLNDCKGASPNLKPKTVEAAISRPGNTIPVGERIKHTEVARANQQWMIHLHARCRPDQFRMFCEIHKTELVGAVQAKGLQLGAAPCWPRQPKHNPFQQNVRRGSTCRLRCRSKGAEWKGTPRFSHLLQGQNNGTLEPAISSIGSGRTRGGWRAQPQEAEATPQHGAAMNQGLRFGGTIQHIEVGRTNRQHLAEGLPLQWPSNREKGRLESGPKVE